MIHYGQNSENVGGIRLRGWARKRRRHWKVWGLNQVFIKIIGVGCLFGSLMADLWRMWMSRTVHSNILLLRRQKII